MYAWCGGKQNVGGRRSRVWPPDRFRILSGGAAKARAAKRDRADEPARAGEARGWAPAGRPLMVCLVAGFA